jgi:hypothetical protein
MKQWLFRLIAIAVLMLLCLWVWRTFFPSPEKIIRDRLNQVAKLASFDSREGDFARMANVLNLVGYFTPDAECIFNSSDVYPWSAHGRDDLRGAALYARSMLTALHVEFFDATVVFAPDKQTATVKLTVRASRPGDKDFLVEEIKVHLRNVSGTWLIARAETVKTLT